MTKSATREAADEVSAPIASPSFTGNVVTQGVNPTITIQDSDEAGDGFIKFKTANGTQRGYIQTAMTSDVMIFGTGTTERMRLISSGGLTFNGDTAAANALDDYEEGSWTPSIGGNATYTNQVGRYIKIGNMVWVNFSIGINVQGTGSTSSGISGLPFASGLASQNTSNLTWYGLGVAMIYGVYYVGAGQSALSLSYTSGASTQLTNNPNSLVNGASINGSFAYTV